MKYCTKCLMPDTRPNIKFFDGVCQGCITYERQSQIDWKQRWTELEKLCAKHRHSNGNDYDCIIAVSGGKDSHFQTYLIKEKLGMNPLLLSAGNLDWTDTGRKNLDNISDAFGCDLILSQPNRKIARMMLKKAFEKIGSPGWYLDSSLYAFPIKMAIKLGIKLVFYGEDVNYTYGGEFSQETSSAIKQSKNDVVKPIWEEWFDDKIITEKDLQSIKHPTEEEIKKHDIQPTYLSYFVPWNSIHNYEVAKRYGFKHLEHEYKRENTLENFDQIDSLSYLINPSLKYQKFGHAIATDYASKMIRYGLRTREEMIPFVEENDGKMDQGAIEKFCEFTRLSEYEFNKLLDKWYNPKLFEQDNHGVWHKKFKVGLGLK